MAKTIVFGASGFVGRSLTSLLGRQGVECLSLSSQALDLTAPGAAEAINCLVRDGDCVIMLSALTPEKGQAAELTVRNVSMIRHMLAGLEGRKLDHFIYVSSDSVYPLSADMVDELTPACPGTLYGHMHAMREQFARDFFSPGQLTILRPCAIYGAGDSHYSYGINRFIRSATENGVIDLFGGGEEYRDHLHVDDFASMVAYALAYRVAGTYNAASGQSWRFVQIAEHIRAHLGRPVRFNAKPRNMALTHRHVDMSRSWQAFPGHKPRFIGAGILHVLDALGVRP